MVDLKKHTFVIAEAGVNHNGSLDLAMDMVELAASAGADAVKFQTFHADQLVTPNVPKADYQVAMTGSDEGQLGMLRRLELSEDDHRRLLVHCNQQGISFLSTPFDEESVDFLTKELGLKTLKIGSGELTNGPLLLKAAETGSELIISTGMSTIDEIKDALSVVAFGYLGSRGPVNTRSFAKAYETEEARLALKKKVTLLQCTTEYPAPVNEINLRAMDTLRATFGLRIGFSDHTQGTAVAIAAVAVGASVLEKHFTLDRNMFGPDHKASIGPDELRSLIRDVRAADSALGAADKEPAASEKQNKVIARRRLVASSVIAKGERFSRENMGVKRSSSGASPMSYWELLDEVADKDYKKDEGIGAQIIRK